MSQVGGTSISDRRHVHRRARRDRRSFAARNRWALDAVRRRLDCNCVLDSPMVALQGVQRMERPRTCRSAFGKVRAARALLQQATERASEILTPRQVLALQLYCEGQPMTAIAARLGLRSRQHLWAAYRRPAVEAVTREFLALAQAEFPSNSP